MRIVLDTNVVVSALLFAGTPLKLLRLCSTNHSLLSSPYLLSELDDVFNRPKFQRKLTQINLTPASILIAYAKQVSLVSPPFIPSVCRDQADNHVLACALEAKADLIVSGDDDLLCLQSFQSIPIKNASDAFVLIQHQEPTKL